MVLDCRSTVGVKLVGDIQGSFRTHHSSQYWKVTVEHIPANEFRWVYFIYHWYLIMKSCKDEYGSKAVKPQEFRMKSPKG